MSLSRETILQTLGTITDPLTGKDIVSADIVRALVVTDDEVRFVMEVDPSRATAMQPVLEAARSALLALPGIGKVNAFLTAHSEKAPPPDLKIGRHPTPQAGPAALPGIAHVIAIASGKGGVGKSTVASNLAVALAAQGRRTGLLDADFYGPSQPRMMGVSDRPVSPDGKTILPPVAHGVTMMSLGLLTRGDEAVVWRGPMLMGALQQMLGQVAWGQLDVLLIDLPPGTGDVQLTLCQKTELTGAILVSTPQDVALLDARKALSMFRKLGTPVLGMIENMSTYICPNCGHEAHLFGHGGAAVEAESQGMPFLGEIPLDLATRLAGDAGTPITASAPDSPQGRAFHAIAQRLVAQGLA